MKPLTKEWVKKSDSDFRVMKREFKVTEDPSYEAVCFHAQQCVEKLVKAFLVEWDLAFPKTHNIEELIKLTLPIRPEWNVLIKSRAFLSEYATDSRYPGDSVYKDEAQDAVNECIRLREIISEALKSTDQLRLN